MKSLVIAYTGNVCSSPTLGMFQHVPQFNVRTFEHLDSFKCGNRTSDDIAGVLEDIHHGRNTKLTRSFGLPEVEDNKPCVLKWRPYVNGPTEKLKSVLRQHYTPVFLARKSLIDNCAKILANERVFGTRWPQFGLATKNVELKEFDEKFYSDLSRLMEQRIHWIFDMLSQMRLTYGGNIPVIYAEDMFKPLVDCDEFLRIFCEITGEQLTLELPENFNPSSLKIEEFVGTTKIKKIGVNLKVIDGYEQLHKNPNLNTIDKRYLAILNGTNKK